LIAKELNRSNEHGGDVQHKGEKIENNNGVDSKKRVQIEIGRVEDKKAMNDCRSSEKVEKMQKKGGEKMERQGVNKRNDEKDRRNVRATGPPDQSAKASFAQTQGDSKYPYEPKESEGASWRIRKNRGKENVDPKDEKVLGA